MARLSFADSWIARLLFGGRSEPAANYDIAGYRRIYLVHIRKTGGTSLNHMFLSLGSADTKELYTELAAKRQVERNGKIFVGWNRDIINRGNYFYAFSHIPLHQLRMPAGTFTLACFRDPVKRVVSHYTMLREFADNRIDHPCMKTEGPWLGRSFDDFIQRIPPEHLLTQIHMFSKNFLVRQAVDRVFGLGHYFFTEDFAAGVGDLNRKLGLGLKAIHIRKSVSKFDIPEASLDRLRSKLDREYEFLRILRTGPCKLAV